MKLTDTERSDATGVNLASLRQAPHVEARRLDGTTVHYRDVWQRQNAVFVSLPDDPSADDYLETLRAAEDDIKAEAAVVLVLRHSTEPGSVQPPPPLPLSSVAVADRWGEIRVLAERDAPGSLPAPGEIIEWLRFLESECPECQGEAR